MIITIASGKGGTGKTTLAVNLAAALATSGHAGQQVRLLDCDVEEPNDHLFVQPATTADTPVKVLKPVWNESLCTGCGECARQCHYNALAVVKGKVLAFPELCHSCGVCSYVCPEGAMTEEQAVIGYVKDASDNEPFAFGYGVLNIGEPLAPAVVDATKELARPDELTIVDASPGTACPVVAAVGGADVALLVTEPTPFGLNDLKLAVGLSLSLDVPTGIVVNRSDGTDAIIQDYADSVGLPVVGRIPFRRAYAETYSTGDLLVDHHPELAERLLAIYDAAAGLVGTPVPEAPPDALPGADAPPAERSPAGGETGYREMTVISGKGGTGKTTVTSCLAVLVDDKVMADCDVDAADLHLLIRPEVRNADDFTGGLKATIDPEACRACGRCAQMCHFNAINPVVREGEEAPVAYEVDDFTCEGCGLCGLVCPFDAVLVEDSVTGRSFISDTATGPMAHARLGIAEENTGKLVTHVRNDAGDLAVANGAPRIIGDGSPGTGCPVIASISGVDLALIVTEPTVSGVHDLERVLQLTRHFGVKALICTNKCDLNADQAARIREMAAQADAVLVGEIPFDAEVNRTLMEGKVLVADSDGPAATAVREMLGQVRQHLG